MQSIDSLIKKYEFEDEALIKEIVRRSTSSELVELINNWFQEESDSEKLNGLIELIKDLFCCRNGWVTRRYSNNFRKALNTSEFPHILENKLITVQNRIHMWLFHFFSRSEYATMPILKKLYQHALKDEPLFIPEIVDAMNGFKDDFNWQIIKNLCGSEDFVHRWAVLEIFGDKNAPDENYYKKKLGFLRLLSKDPNPFVKQEASCLLAKALFDHAYTLNTPKNESARTNYFGRMRPYRKAVDSIMLRYTFLDIKRMHNAVVLCIRDTIPSREIIEGVLMFGWQYSPYNNDYWQWLAKRVKEYIKKN